MNVRCRARKNNTVCDRALSFFLGKKMVIRNAASGIQIKNCRISDISFL
jgi:hypothetical protein